MKKKSTCRKCGVPLTTQAREGICPKCLLEQALVDQTGGESSEGALESEPVIAEGPGTIIGRYKLLEKIGEGGFGVVYMAEQEEPVRRRVALKIIKLGMDTKEIIARFEAERQALALMEHPNIAKVFDGGATDTGRPYFVMELVRGVRITEYCDQKRLSPKHRLELFMQVCQAVQHAHQKGIVHRDLKPSNILVTVNDGVPVPKVIDFGIAKATGMRLTDKTLFTRFLHLLGTPAYMSPEQVEMTSVDVDTRSDIYSLGVLLYELLTGKTPFDAQDLLQAGVDEMRRRIRDEEPPKPSTRLSTLTDAERTTAGECRSVEGLKLIHLVRGDLDWIAMKCLEKERARRYETASGLAADLKHYLSEEPVLAGPPTVRYRAKKFVLKHRVAMAVAAGFGVLLMVASIVSTSLALLVKQKAEAESKAKVEAQRQQERAEAALTEMKIQRAEEFFEADDFDRAVAQLAEVLRHDRLNRIACDRLLSALAVHNFSLPHGKPFRHERGIHSAKSSPGGLQIVTASEDKTARVWDARTGKPLSELLRHTGTVLSAQFSPDGVRVVTASADQTARVWEMNLGLPPVPAWLPELAELVRSRRLTGSSVLEFVAEEELVKFQQQLHSSAETNYFVIWAKWVLADRSTRTISPLSPITVPQYVQRRIEENTLDSLHEAVLLSPTNGLAYTRLAKQVLAQSDEENPRRVGEADFFSRYALKWSLNDPEVINIREEIEELKNTRTDEAIRNETPKN